MNNRKTLKAKINGMHCEHCVSSVSNAIKNINGVEEVKIDDWRNGNTEIIFSNDISTNLLEEVVKKAGYTIETIQESQFHGTTSWGYDFDLLIIGGGSAAFAAAIKASELEKKVLMINSGLPVGGTCVNVGCVPSKTLIRTAEQFYAANHPNFNGIKSANNKIDFKEVIRQKTALVDGLRQDKYVDVLKDDPNVTILKAHAKFVDKNSVEADKKIYTADKILIATGSKTFIPEVSGLRETGYLTNVTLYELEELPEHLIVIGGRYIALENAQLFARLGSKVTILQRSFRILPDEMPDVTETIKDYLEEEGIKIITGVKINSIEKKNGKVVVNASVKDEDKTFEGSHIFVATGRKGNTNNLELDKLSVELHKQSFIKTNKFLQTSIPNIYAAGDVTGEYLFVYSAAYEGSLAVMNMFGENQTQKDYSVFPWVIFTDPQVAGVGMDENQAYENKIDYEVSTVQLKDVPRSLASRNTKGFIKLIRNKKNDKLIGARILASEGSELLMEVSLAINYGITVKELKQIFHPYLTLSEGIKIAAISFDKDVKKLSCCAV